MADLDDSNDLEIETDPIEHMKKKLKRQQWLVFGSIGVASISLISAILAIALVFIKTPNTAEIEERANAVSAELRAADEGLRSQIDTMMGTYRNTQSELQTLSQQLANLDVNDQRNVIIRVQRILIRQEQDFRDFLTALENGMYNFHMMVPHSRGWWDDYQKELLEASELSKARENYVVNLRNN
ncbi:MAG: hypothetical protein R3332_05125 [Pseudohongiellaceae bacterium]|nr:hypothetical protein [Pseudohongiellaceae bacterium]